MPYSHNVFGLNLASAVDLHGLPPATGRPDVVIRMGITPESLPAPSLRRASCQAEGSSWLMTAKHVAGARFLVREGREIIVDPEASCQESVLRLFLQGSCMGALLLQRGLVPLHASTVGSDRGAVVLAGRVGAGKSTLALALLRRGYRLLADDLSAVDVPGGLPPSVRPGFACLKLGADACELFGIDTRALSGVGPELEKFHYPVEASRCNAAQPLRAVYVLVPAPGESPAIEPLSGIARLKELQAHLYKMVFREAQRNWPWLFHRIAAIARHARVCLVRRPKRGFGGNEVADLIEADLAS